VRSHGNQLFVDGTMREVVLNKSGVRRACHSLTLSEPQRANAESRLIDIRRRTAEVSLPSLSRRSESVASSSVSADRKGGRGGRGGADDSARHCGKRLAPTGRTFFVRVLCACAVALASIACRDANVDLEALDAPFNMVLFDAQDLIKFGGTVIKDTLCL
jgi:hypothetical protein